MRWLGLYLASVLFAVAAHAASFEIYPELGDGGSGQLWVWATFDGHLDRCLLDSGA